MEALSIQAVKVNYRPAGTQAQGELGDIFQALLRDSVEQLETAVLPPRADDRPERETPRRDVTDRSVDVSGADRRDRPADKDTDYSVYDVPAAAESRPAPDNDTVTANIETLPKTRQSSESDQPSAKQKVMPANDSDTPTPNGVQKTEEQTATVNGNHVVGLNPTQPNAVGQGVAEAGGKANPAVVLPAASGKAAATAATNQAQNPAPATSTPASVGGNGFSAQITVTPAQVVATPSASLGGGAASAAIAAANATGQVVPATPNTEPTTGTVPGTPTLPIQNSDAQAGRQAGTLSNAQNASTDGQALATQSASITATATKQDAGSASSEARDKATLNSTLAKDASIRPAQSGQTQVSGQNVTGQYVRGQNITDQGEGTKTASAQNQQTQSAPQVQANQAANAAIQTGGTTMPTQGPRVGEPGRSTGSADGASNRAVSTVATGGFTQALAQSPDALGSLTRSGGTHPTAANQVAVEIHKAFNAGKDQIRIRLHPAELGQIDVSLKVRHDGTVKAIVTIDRPETFDLMQRDARGLERALQDAGLKTDSGSLTFNLRGGDQQAPNDGQRGQGLTAQSNPESDRTAASQLPETNTPVSFVSDRALDIHV